MKHQPGLPRAIDENLHFLCAELDSQLSKLQDYFKSPSEAQAQRLVMRAGYSWNLRQRVHDASLQKLSRRKVSESERLMLTNMELIARSLDLISRHARRCVWHAEEVRCAKLLRSDVYGSAIKLVRKTVANVMPAIEARDSREAVAIGQAKAKVEDRYRKLFGLYTGDMRKGDKVEDLAHCLLTANEMRRMGDALESIGEALISVNIGQSVQFERFYTLRSVLAENMKADPTMEPLAETKSGSAISAVQAMDGDTAVTAVFKDGDISKVREERAGVKSWHTIYPGLAPKILSYAKNGKSAALLIEHLPGHTLEHILLNEGDALLAEARGALSKTLRDVWTLTRTDEPAEMKSMKQLAARMGDVVRVHPEFDEGRTRIGGLKLPAFNELVAEAAVREAKLGAPFSVFIHGDFNLDNIIYDPAEKRIHFIDLHRSRYMDYVQDMSVFLVSMYRLQIHDVPIRRRIAAMAQDYHKVTAKFARRQKDTTFEYRLALGLARSFASSTRFVLDRAHARRMFQRSRFLLDTALACPEGKEHRLRLPIEELFRE
ncbi:aminoglycoside phosphotransferase family protein [Chachezhania antarctica]|uniref:aminoglycoside phosphotransferase family protein n=1 Tax=Chachezhania antarctica TaxID=2340860 RepID=UPI000EACE712|nr:aminoglycoside phosphotransferase family protein [Chachezhania antarctica]|tara:strand:+ start:2238 stop:3875 length:1638 start_codon:yes stop_codon:yes gene_type:complete